MVLRDLGDAPVAMPKILGDKKYGVALIELITKPANWSAEDRSTAHQTLRAPPPPRLFPVTALAHDARNVFSKHESLE